MQLPRQHLTLLIAAIVLISAVLATSAPNGTLMRAVSETTGSAGLDSATTDSVAMFDEAYDGREMGTPLTTAANVEQKVIKTGEMDIEVDNTDDSVATIVDLANTRGGFVASSNVREDAYGNKRGDVTIRVPVAVFDETMTDIAALANKVVSESSNGQDVTEEYTDLTARLGAARAQEAQYLVVLQSANSVGDILAVQEHLGDIRATIESLQGQVNYLENRTSLSTITVSLSETSRITLPSEKFSFVDQLRDAAHTLVVVFQKLVAAVIWVVIVAGPFAIVAYGIYRAWRRFVK